MGGRQERIEAVTFRPAAAREFVEAVEYYEQEREGRGARFADAVERALSLIAALPETYPLLRPPDIRSAKVRGFPYRVIYVTMDGAVDVLAVAHAKRRTGYWRRRSP